MNKALIVHYGNDPQFLAIAWQLAADARDAGDDPVMLDITNTSPGIGDTYNRRVLGAFGQESPDAQFSRLLDAQGVETAASVEPNEESSEDEIETELSVNSALISFARDPQPPLHKRFWRALERRLRNSAIGTHSVVTQTLKQHPEIGTVYVANGRLPNQRAAVDATLQCHRSLLVYEKGNVRDTYWLEDHSPLERTKTQLHVDSKLSVFSPVEAIELGREWMDQRASLSSEDNIYSRFFAEDTADALPATRRKVVGLYTSSQDEFASLGEDWQLQDWEEQIAAFDHVLSTLTPRGYAFYLRVHPNFITKSHASFVREGQQLHELAAKYPALKVFWHDEQVNSYSLLETTDAVVVWNSTLGLEANGRGIPVWHLAPSYYDIYADVRPWFGPETDPSDDEFFYTPDTTRTLRFMAYLAVRDRPLPPDALAVRDSLTPAPRVATRLAALAASGGAPTARVAFASVTDAVRHRRARINRIAVHDLLARGRTSI